MYDFYFEGNVIRIFFLIFFAAIQSSYLCSRRHLLQALSLMFEDKDRMCKENEEFIKIGFCKKGFSVKVCSELRLKPVPIWFWCDQSSWLYKTPVRCIGNWVKITSPASHNNKKQSINLTSCTLSINTFTAWEISQFLVYRLLTFFLDFEWTVISLGYTWMQCALHVSRKVYCILSCYTMA